MVERKELADLAAEVRESNWWFQINFTCHLQAVVRISLPPRSKKHFIAFLLFV